MVHVFTIIATHKISFPYFGCYSFFAFTCGTDAVCTLGDMVCIRLWKRTTIILWPKRCNIFYDSWIFIAIVLLFNADLVVSIRRGNLIVPPSYSPIDGDLYVQLHTDGDETVKPPSTNQTNNNDVRLQVTRIDNGQRTTAAIIDVYPDPRMNITQIVVPCQKMLFGGQYELEIVGNDIVNSVNVVNSGDDERLRKKLDVRWPTPKISLTSDAIETYPQNPVDVILEFPGNVECALNLDERTDGAISRNDDMVALGHVPEFWLELYYCGHEVYCDSTNVSSSQILFAEKITGYPKAKMIKLRCELFGLAGHHIVKLRPISPIPITVSATGYIRTDWSEQYVFNVHARSITPCDPHTGIIVLFQYPACILDRADRVRLFAKLRADVASLAPPTSLHYVSEQRVIRGQHSLYFDCDLFSERFIEYCFVYVSQAISGAVADVRMDCLPTLPVGESDKGGWGPWSPWTSCSTTCAGGTRNRYRVCDSPPPRYGAKFCEGSAIETQKCGGPMSGSWECMYGNGLYYNSILPADRPDVREEIGPGCRCGCIVHLTMAKPKRIIASSAESCPGRSFWLIQADYGHQIRFHVDFFRLICSTQYLKIRDGDSLASDLIGEYTGGSVKYSDPIVSSESQLLIEFSSDNLSAMDGSCKGGFLTDAEQLQPHRPNVTVPVSRAAMSFDQSQSSTRMEPNYRLINIVAIAFASFIIVVSALLGAQYVLRYRKYQLALNNGEPDSPAHTPRASLNSINGAHLTSRAASTSTLLSEVISLVKLRPKGRSCLKHSRLRESVDGEAVLCDGNGERSNQIANRSDDDLSVESSHTLTNETLNDLDNPQRTDNSQDEKISSNSNEPTFSHSDPSSPSQPLTSTGSSLSLKSVSPQPANTTASRYSPTPKCDDSLSTSINSINLPLPPKRRGCNNGTPIPQRKYSKIKSLSMAKNKLDARRLRTESINSTTSEKLNRNKLIIEKDCNSISGCSINCLSGVKDGNPIYHTDYHQRQKMLDTDGETDVSEPSTSSSILRQRRIRKKMSISNITLTNGCYSPAGSITSSKATVRTTNIKECKEKQNREKALAGPGSEFSLANPEDFELDYYDYNVSNAGSVPGSYLGMDPAYLVWIPPLDESSVINEDCDEDDNELDEELNEESDSDEINTGNNMNCRRYREEPHYEEILPNYSGALDPGSNTETPSEDNFPPDLPPLNYLIPSQPAIDNREQENRIIKSTEISRILASTTFIEEDIYSKSLACGSKDSGPANPKRNSSSSASSASIPLHDFSRRKLDNFRKYNDLSPIKVHGRNKQGTSCGTESVLYMSRQNSQNEEKETVVIKSPILKDSVHEYYELDDIKFADDEDGMTSVA